MLALRDKIRRAAPSNINVLISGETGTGKELVAKALHAQSHRHDGPLIAINCAAIPEHLMESELFGHERGAFTGALTRRYGKIEAADGGTLFLDEIGDMPPTLQAKLLRFTEDRHIERLGSNQRLPVDVRIVAATHQNIPRQISSGQFRQDLYYRLAELTLQVPPLRARNGDILLLAHHFVRRFSQATSRTLTDEAIYTLSNWHWPGNVRELESNLKRACLLASNKAITAADFELFDVARTPDELPLAAPHKVRPEAFRSSEQAAMESAPVPTDTSLYEAQENAGRQTAARSGKSAPLPINLQEARRNAEQSAIIRALSSSDENLTKAAKLLGVTRPTLYNLLEKHNLSPTRH